MSVPTSQRKENTMEYVKKGMELYMVTSEVFSCIENTYPEIYHKMLDLANSYYVASAEADSIFLDNWTRKTIFNMRRELLYESVSYITAYRYQLNLLSKLIKRGDGRFGKKTERDAKFHRVAKVANEATKLVNGIINSDRERWDSWHSKGKGGSNSKKN